MILRTTQKYFTLVYDTTNCKTKTETYYFENISIKNTITTTKRKLPNTDQTILRLTMIHAGARKIID